MLCIRPLAKMMFKQNKGSITKRIVISLLGNKEMPIQFSFVKLRTGILVQMYIGSLY